MKDAADILNAILNAAGTNGPAALTGQERVLFHANVFLIEFDMGGLSGFLYGARRSGPGSDWSAVAQAILALEQLQEPSTAAHLRRALEIVEAIPVVEDGTWGRFLAEVDPDGELNALDSQIGEASKRIWDRLYAAALLLPAR